VERNAGTNNNNNYYDYKAKTKIKGKPFGLAEELI